MSMKIKGVTLIELAIVLFIVSLILGGVLVPLSTRLEQEERKKTTEMLVDIKESLIGYALVNGHFPCPDCPDNSTGNCGIVETGLGSSTINDGFEDGTDATATTPTNTRPNYEKCATTEGNLPWSNLGLPEFDAWDNHFLYRVTEEFADDDDGTTTGCTAVTANVSFCLGSEGDINIDDETSGSPYAAEKVPFVVLSYGNDDSSSGTSQAENQDGDNVFVYKDYSSETDAYDDLMTWVSSASLMFQMVRAELIP